MAMKKCPRCGEYYSDTYRECPFCDEDDYDDYRPRRRRGGGGGLLGPVLIIIAILVIAFVAWSLFGPEIQTFVQDRIGTHQVDSGTTTGDTSGDTTGDTTEDTTEDTTGGDTSGDTTTDSDGAVKPGVDGDTTGGNTTGGDTTGGDTSVSKAVVLSKEDVTLSAGESFTLTATGGDGKSYEYDSEDPGIASVDSAGKVTAISSGTTSVTVKSGDKSSECIVRVKKSAATGNPAAGTSTAAPSSAVLSKTDVTLSVGETFKISVTGGTLSYWSTSNNKIVDVDSSGSVKATGSGTASIIAVMSDGAKLKCVVRVK